MDAHTNSQGPLRPRWHYVLGMVVALVVISDGTFWRYGRPLLLGIEASVYAFLLLLMDLTKKQMTATTTVGQLTAPENQFAVMTHDPNADFRLIPRTGLGGTKPDEMQEVYQAPTRYFCRLWPKSGEA